MGECVGKMMDYLGQLLVASEPDEAKQKKVFHREEVLDVMQKEIVQEVYNPTINPDDFTTDITNKYFPVEVGRKLVYEASTDEGELICEVSHNDNSSGPA